MLQFKIILLQSLFQDKSCIIPPDSAVMFCYFNNNQYFHKYLEQYQGKCVILIGPIDGKRHCDPEPDYLMVCATMLFKYLMITLLGSWRMEAAKQSLFERWRQD